MKRIYAFAIGLAMMVSPMAAVPGLAAADPGLRSTDYQQATDVVIARGLSQRGCRSRGPAAVSPAPLAARVPASTPLGSTHRG
ncbi:hypothetical protein NIIDMKKI_40010 [Mycobacterium kansasii]|uniref:DUF732 domain-containing protein n=1 Tax=Mycobacterium kansasii TaxID=1768 RepID=A0A7G1IG94_MYCKA|nr:hypothetical protein NIIDMKKI_40010 [Mycobacterium kansasii]